MTSSNIQTKELRYSWVEVSEQLNSWLKTTNQPTKKYSEKFSIRKGSSFCDTLEFTYLFFLKPIRTHEKTKLTIFPRELTLTVWYHPPKKDYDVASSSFIGQVYFHFRYRKAKSLIPVRGRVAKPELYSYNKLFLLDCNMPFSRVVKIKVSAKKKLSQRPS